MRHSSIWNLLTAKAQVNPDAIAIRSTGQRSPLTYDRLRNQVGRTVELLRGAGISSDDRVAVVIPNGPEMAVAFLAVASCATCAPLNPQYSASEFDYYLDDLNPKAILVQSNIYWAGLDSARARGIAVIQVFPAIGAESGIFDLESANGLRHASSTFSEESNVALMLHTSGTTSKPKIVPLTQANILTSAENIERGLALTEADCCLNVMPLFHVHGLIGAVLSSLLAGSSITCTPGLYAPQFFDWIAEFRPTWYTAVPSMHQAILARARANGNKKPENPLRFIRSCSSPLAPQVMLDLEQFFNAPVIEAYGMTEGSHQIAANPLPPGRRKPGTVGLALGPQVAIFDENGQVVPRGQRGEIVIKGENVFGGYTSNSLANSASFSEGWFRTGDLGYVDEDGYLTISGRVKEMINRGGEKISPREVEEILLEHSSVEQAVCFPIAHPELGEDIVAAVVLRNGFRPSEREIREFAASRLVFFKVPRQIIFLDDIPKGPTGKLKRNGLAERLGLSTEVGTRPAPPKAEFVLPQTPLEKSLSRIWEEVLGIEQLGIHDDFLACGGDSVLAAQIIARVRDRMQVEVSLLTFFDAPTIAGMASSFARMEETVAVSDDA